MSVRIYAIAKKLGVENKEIIAQLKKMGIKVKSHSSSVDDDVAKKLEKGIKSAQPKKPRKKATKKKPVKAAAKPKRKKPVAKTKVALRPEVVKRAAKIAEKKTRVTLPVTVRGLAEILGIKPPELISKLMSFGVMATINQSIDAETVEIIGHDYGKELDIVKGKPELKEPAVEGEAELVPRAPVVTFMGHIDHGKTSLLDAIRESRIVARESGGITQHIGAYEIELDKGKVTFLDTPGHETFTSMRARGANITDIAVLVVAADDGVMPQTREAIDHARAAKVPIVVAINKIDKANASVDKVKRQLIEMELIPEDYGGQTICCEVSATTKQGLDHMLEMILLQSEMMELKANRETGARAVVIEAKMDRGRGPVATVLMKSGTLRVGAPVVCGLYFGKVKALFDYLGNRITEAGPAKPVEVLGLNGVPPPGDELRVVDSEKEARKITKLLRLKEGEEETMGEKMTLEQLFSKIEAGKAKELKLIAKGDVQGSVEALCDSLKKLSTDKVSVNIIHCAVSDINENDVMLASASDAVVIGFHTRIDLKAKELSRREQVEIKLYDVIYEVIDDVRKAMEGLLEPAIKETILGRAEVKQLFRASKGDCVAGSLVLEGKVVGNARARIIRGEKIIHEGAITSLRRFKDQVKEVKSGLECGVRIGDIEDIQEGDIIEVFKMEKVAQKL